MKTMNFFDLLYTLIITPLQLFFEVVFAFAQRFTDDPGLSIIVLSLTVNILVLPLYKRADAIQSEQREIEKRLKPEMDHIKKTFSGDEKMMILNTYYSQNDYSPMGVFRESISLFLQIPFFMAAYQFLSNLALLNGTSFGPIKDMGLPDGLLTVAGVSINVLPILMTAINLVSSMIYTKDFPLKSKVQLYAMAGFFLLFLYSSPAGLVFYWTLNNLFSLIKNIMFKLKDSRRIVAFLLSVIGIVGFVYGLFFFHNTLKRRLIVAAIGVLFQVPLIIHSVSRSGFSFPKLFRSENKYDYKRFMLSGILLTVLIGSVTTSALIKSSPQEFIYIALYQNPVWYIVYATCIVFGTFVIWMGVFYYIADGFGKMVLERVLWCFCGIAIIDYMFFGTDLGVILPNLQFQEDIQYSFAETAINSLLIVVVIVVMFCIIKKKEKAVPVLSVVMIISLSIMAAVNIAFIQRTVEPIASTLESRQESAHIPVSRDGKNVIVFMLDRAIGPYIPYIMNEKPELKESFDGFTYYANSLSFGGNTNFGTPPIFGGYEYTPTEINKRSQVSLKDKQNEALRLMPLLFDDEGYSVTVCDPTYANYQFIPDTSIYSDHPGINTFSTSDITNKDVLRCNIINNRRNFFFYGMTKVSPLFMQKYIYNGGRYNRMAKNGDVSTVQVTDGYSKAHGIEANFMIAYSALSKLKEITNVENEKKGTFLMITNNATHEPNIVQEPEYLPAETVDNEEYDASHMDRFTVDGRQMKMENEKHYAHYESNVACLMKIGEWFDYLRENGVYDNTRIILVSDHGNRLNQFDELMVDNEDIEGYSCLLMEKDFNSHGFTTSDEFMTTGDVPTMAFDEVIMKPVNPSTGKVVNSDEKKKHDQYVITSYEWDTLVNNGTQFLPSNWLAVHDNIWDKNNWRVVAEDTVFTGEEE